MTKAIYPKHPTLIGTPDALRFPEGYITSSSWQRAQTEELEAIHINDHEIMARLGDGSYHRTIFHVSEGTLIGRCTCKGFVYRDWCAHVAALWWSWCAGSLIVRDVDAGQVLVWPPAWLSVDDREVNDGGDVKEVDK